LLPLPLQDPVLKFGLAAGQAHQGRDITKVMKNGATDMGASERFKGCFEFLAIKLGGPNQAEHARLLKIFTGFAAESGVMNSQGAHQLAVGLNATIPLLQLGCGQGKRAMGLGGMGPDHGNKNENKG